MKASLGLFLLGLLISVSANAQSNYSDSGASRIRNAAYANAGFSAGGFALGADIELAAGSTFGIGGYTRFYQKDDSPPRTSDGYFTLGAFIRPHFHRKEWDFYVSPGFGVVSIDGRTDDETTFGPSVAFGLLYQFQNQMAFGIENMKHYVWFSDDYRGLVVDDLTLKFRVSF